MRPEQTLVACICRRQDSHLRAGHLAVTPDKQEGQACKAWLCGPENLEGQAVHNRAQLAYNAPAICSTAGLQAAPGRWLLGQLEGRGRHVGGGRVGVCRGQTAALSPGRLRWGCCARLLGADAVSEATRQLAEPVKYVSRRQQSCRGCQPAVHC